MRFCLVLLLVLFFGCSSATLRPIEVVSRADLYIHYHNIDPDMPSFPSGSLHTIELAKLKAWAEAPAQGFLIDTDDLQSINLAGRVKGKHITLDEALTPDGSLNVLLHELAHYILPYGDTRSESETLAEITAYLVAQRLNWDTPQSLAYLGTLNSEASIRTSLHYEIEILAAVDFLTKIIR